MNDSRKVSVEIKSLNSKQLDLSMRIPSIYKERENQIRTLVSRELLRGKVEVFVNFENFAATTGNFINHDKFMACYNELSELCQKVGRPVEQEKLFSCVLRMPDVMETQKVEVSADELDMVMSAAEQAVANINAFREQEGAVLIADLLARVDTIAALVCQVEPYEAARVETTRARIMDNFAKLNLNVDNNRLEQEMIFYIEKLDITEEKVRLRQHCDYFRLQAQGSTDEGVGRKLGFVAQEMGREINTMGSKANHHEIQKIVVVMKDELEKIKEQLLNIL